MHFTVLLSKTCRQFDRLCRFHVVLAIADAIIGSRYDLVIMSVSV